MNGFFRAGLVTAVVLSSSGASAEPTPVPGKNVPQHYARLCNRVNTPALADLTNAAEADLEKRAAAAVHIASLHLLVLTPAPGDGKGVQATFTESDGVHPRYYTAELDASGALGALTSTDAKNAFQYLKYFRWISAYEYLNELLEVDSDAAARCSDAFAHAYAGAFGTALRNAVINPGEATAAFAGSVRNAFARFDETNPGRGDGAVWTQQTRVALGTLPQVRLIYRDRGFPDSGLPEIDIVRLGTTPYTYVEVYVFGNRVDIAVSPICIVGDRRCASAYVWP